jgi:thiol-disulfide isomerase/thioredoxin
MKKNLLFVAFMLSVAFVNAQTILSENFEGGKLPAGWQNVSEAADGGWLFGKIATLKSTAMGYTGNTTSFATSNDDKGDQTKLADLLITPKLNLSGKKVVFMSFNAYFGGRTDAGIKEGAFVQSSKDAGKTWTDVAEITPTINDAKTAVIWKTQTVDISSFNKDTAVWFAIKFTDNGGYLYGLGVDDIKIYTPAEIDAAFKLDSYKKYALKSDAVEVKGTITNNGSSTITEVDMTYKVGTTTETKKIKGLNIAPLATAELAHPTAYSYKTTGLQSFDVSIDKINNVAVTNTSNFKTIVISKNVQRNVVFEEATGTWCPWCPRGAVYMDSMANVYPKEFIGIAVHNSIQSKADPMLVAVYDAGLTKTPGFPGFPSVVVDRTDVIDPSEMFDVYDAARAELNPFTLSHKITYDSLTRKATITVKGAAAMTTKGDYRFNVVLSENGVKGTTSGYAQANNYAGGNNGEMGGYELLPNPVPAKNMVYNHVGRAILGTYEGVALSIPTDIEEGKEYTYDFTYTVPTAMKPANMHVVSMVLDAESGQILTGVTDKLVTKKVGTNDIFENNTVSVYPNPMSEEANIEISTASNVEVSVKVFNVMGQQVAARNYGKMSGKNILPFVSTSLPNGIYTIHVQMGDKLATKKVTIQK